jgi:hypothetical protein
MALNQALKSYYEKYGDIISRPQAQVVWDVAAYAKKNNVSVSQALQENFIKPLQSKPQYQAMIKKATGEWEMMNLWDSIYVKDANGNWTYKWSSATQKWSYEIDPVTWQIKTSVTGSGKLPEEATRAQRQNYISWIVSANATWWIEQIASGIASIEDWTKWWQCWAFANDISKALWSSVHFWDSLESKTKRIDPNQKAEVWTFVVMTSKNVPWSWHVGMITSVNNDWTITIKSSNYKWDEKVRTDTIPANSASIKWYVKPSVNVNKTAKPLTDDQRMVYNSQLDKFRWNQEVKAFESAITKWAWLIASLNNPSWPADIASVFSFMKSLDPASVVREWEFALAQKSAWLAPRTAQRWEQQINWEILTDNQRKEFAKVAKLYIDAASQTYDRLYDDMVRVTDNMWIDRSYIPTRASDVIKTPSTVWTNYWYSQSNSNPLSNDINKLLWL